MLEKIKRRLMVKWLERIRQDKAEYVENCYLGLEIESNKEDREFIINSRTESKKDHFHLCNTIKLLKRMEEVK
jgi:hypothetical protein